MADRHTNSVCDSCGGVAIRNEGAESPGIKGKGYSRPIHSDALAIHPDQVEEHRRAFPNIELDSECRPILDNFQEHDKYLKKIGFVKRPQKIKRKGRRIA